MKEQYQLTTDELKKEFNLTDFTQGLTSKEVQQKLASDGQNVLEVKPTPKWKIFLRQFNNIVIYILLVATLLTIIIGHYTDAIVIGAVVVLNSLIGYFQETSAANALAKIKEMMANQATVYRDGKRQDIDAADLVVGDVVFLEAGDNVPADLRIVSADNLRIEESALTGETNSVIKTDQALTDNDIPLAERVNMAYASTSVTSGSGLGVVIATAEQTEIGKISQEVAHIKPKKTPLTREIDHVGTVVSYITITIQFAFVFEKAEDGIMERSPRPITQRLMNRHDLFQMGYVSALMAIFALIGYEWFIRGGASEINATTMMVNTIVISKVFYFFSIRTEQYGLTQINDIGKNAWGVIGLMIIFQLILTYVPFMQTAFHVTGISLAEWGAVILFSCLIMIFTEGDKWIRSRMKKA